MKLVEKTFVLNVGEVANSTIYDNDLIQTFNLLEEGYMPDQITKNKDVWKFTKSIDYDNMMEVILYLNENKEDWWYGISRDERGNGWFYKTI